MKHISLILLTAPGITQAVHVYRAGSKLRRRPRATQRTIESQRLESSSKLIVLLPAYEAANEVGDAFKWFSSEEIDDGHTEYVFITTAREHSDVTAQVCATLVSSHERFHHLHSTRTPFCKASQLNDAVTWSKERWADAVDLRFAVYDIDGRPEVLPNTAVRGRFADIEQQVPLPARPAEESKSAVGRGHAAVQTVRALATEYGGWVAAQERYGRSLLLGPSFSPAKYCWGNGLVIRAEALDRIGGFPVPVDDLEIGFDATVQGWTAEIRSEIVWHAAYADPKQMLRSLGFILKGDNALGNDRWHRSSPAQRFRLVLARFVKLAKLLEPLVWVGVLVCSSQRFKLLLLILGRFALPAVVAARALSHLVVEADSPLVLDSPNLRDTVAASMATPGIRLFAWAKGHTDSWRKHGQ